MNDEDVIKAVRWRYRICNYLFKVGMAWIAGGEILMLRKAHYAVIIGAGIMSAALAVTVAIYRCPVCDRYLSRFRPSKDRCGHCGAKVR